MSKLDDLCRAGASCEEAYEAALEEIDALRQQLAAALDEARMAKVSADEVRSTYAEEMRKLSKQLSDHIKREVMLRVKLSEIAWSNDSKWQSDCAKEALAATADLDGLILCYAELCRDDGRCQYAIDHGAEGLGHCPEGKCCMPLYCARETK